VAIVLSAQGWHKGALTWLLIVTATFAATLAFKLIFLSCSPVFGPLDVRSPSGHVATAAVVTGGLCAMLTRRRTTILPAATLAAIVIGLSRLVLGVHTLPETLFGALIGLTGAAALLRFTSPPPRLRLTPLVLVVIVVATVFHGLHLPAEAAIRHTAFRLTSFIPACRGTPDYQYWLHH
jgi:membrane-associated phospholipid phosphatase